MPVWFGLIGVRVAAGLVVMVLLAGAIVVPRMQLKAERAAHLETKRAFSEAQIAAERKARQLQDQQQAAVDTARKTLDETRSQIRRRDAALAAARADARGLRNKLATFGAGLPGETLASCDARSRALADAVAGCGELLSEGQQLVRFCAAHDERAAEVRALLSAWGK